MSDTELSILMDQNTGIKKHCIVVEEVGPIDVFVEGDLEKLRVSSNIFLSLHDVGSSYKRWVEFNKSEDMTDMKHRALFLHVSLPGQTPGVEDLTNFPSLDTLGLGLVNILDNLRISRVLLLGEGAGANIALRFMLHHPARVHGAVLVNCSGSAGQLDRWTWAVGHIGRKARDFDVELNLRNVEKYDEANRGRTELLSKLSDKVTSDVLVVTGNKKRQIKDGEAILERIQAGLCSIIKVEDTTDPLQEVEDKVADAVVLFAQGLGLVPNARRKISRCTSTSEDGLVLSMVCNPRKMSMEQADMPNFRRFSLSDSHNI
jgi:hypothetical protein